MTNEQRITAITEKLETAFQPSLLEVIDESHKHIGHEGAKTGMGHFKVRINATSLNNLSEIKAHRAIYTSLDSLMKTDIHALSIELTKD
jgi:BolA protein